MTQNDRRTVWIVGIGAALGWLLPWKVALLSSAAVFLVILCIDALSGPWDPPTVGP